MPDTGDELDIKDLPGPLRAIVTYGPWLVAAVGIVIICYPIIGSPSATIATTSIVFGGLLVVTGAIIPRAKSFKLSSTGLSFESGTFAGPATSPRPQRHPAAAAAEAPGSPEPHLRVDDTPPTIGAVVDAATRQHWTASTKGGLMTLTNSVGQSFSFNRSDAADPISDGFLSALRAYGLDWPG